MLIHTEPVACAVEPNVDVDTGSDLRRRDGRVEEQGEPADRKVDDPAMDSGRRALHDRSATRLDTAAVATFAQSRSNGRPES